MARAPLKRRRTPWHAPAGARCRARNTSVRLRSACGGKLLPAGRLVLGDLDGENARPARECRTAFPQRRHAQGDDIQPVIKILAEAAVRDRLRQDSCWTRRSRARPPKAVPSCRCAAISRSCRTRSSLACSGSGISPISSRKMRAAMRLFEQAHARVDGAGEGALGVAEQLGFEQMIGKSRAVDGDHSGPRAAARRMQRAGRHFLAGAGLAGDQNRGAAVRDQLNNFDHFTHRRAGANQ